MADTGVGCPPSIADGLTTEASNLVLDDGARVAVVGGGPAGSFFSYFLLKMAEAVDLHVGIDIYEPRSFGRCGPGGCNHCGGIVSESLVQAAPHLGGAQERVHEVLVESVSEQAHGSSARRRTGPAREASRATEAPGSAPR
jgi:hypothetical protein